ncbi:MAG: PepSY domain-containing protein [Bacillota bacterium]|nr:PepSY domain-containing protein [Bacillota bacterium]
MEGKKVKRSVKLGVAAAVAIVVAGVSIYATSVSADESITESEAKQIALSEVKGADISHITKFQKDKDDGRTEYDVEIIYDGYEYDFEISAKDGKIFDRSKEKADAKDLAEAEAKAPVANESNSGESKTVVVDQSSSSSSDYSNSGSSSEISLEEAKSIALSQVSGASKGNITKAEKDYDDGRAEYEIEIEYNGYEYEFEISASSGNILSKDVDRIDDDDWDDRYDD